MAFIHGPGPGRSRSGGASCSRCTIRPEPFLRSWTQGCKLSCQGTPVACVGFFRPCLSPDCASRNSSLPSPSSLLWVFPGGPPAFEPLSQELRTKKSPDATLAATEGIPASHPYRRGPGTIRHQVTCDRIENAPGCLRIADLVCPHIFIY